MKLITAVFKSDNEKLFQIFHDIEFLQDLMLNFKSRFANRAFVVEILKLFQNRRSLLGDDATEFDHIINEIEKNAAQLENSKFRAFVVPVRNGPAEVNVDFI